MQRTPGAVAMRRIQVNIYAAQHAETFGQRRMPWLVLNQLVCADVCRVR